MEKIKILHNNRCSKSRQTLEILNSIDNLDIEIINYLENPPTKKELINILDMLKITSIDLIRKNESDYKEFVKNNSKPNKEEALELLIKFPKLIERPIVIYKSKAVIGRPPEKVLELLK